MADFPPGDPARDVVRGRVASAIANQLVPRVEDISAELDALGFFDG
jgi:hypothetical protein